MPFPRALRRAGRSLASLSVLIATLALLPACASFAATGPLGEQATAVILVNFSDNTTQPRTPAEIRQLVFGDVSDFFWEASYQQAFLSGDTFGWFTIPVSMADCSWNAIESEGNRAAIAAGANLAGYTRFIYLFPNASGCVGGGGGDVGPAGEQRVFINGASGFTTQMIAHELGHRFGLQHSDALDCDISALGDTCIQRGYSDTADVMGSFGHFNAFQKERLGWLNAGASPPLTTVTASGRYTLAPYETPGTGAKALKILKGTDPATGQKTWYYLEYRQPIGFDTRLGGFGNLTTGVQVRTGTITSGGLGTSLLLDMTPSSNAVVADDIQDGALGVGRSYTDAVAGVGFTVVSADSGGAVVDVSVAAPVPPPAPPALTESVGTDQSTYVRGATVYMSARVLSGGVPLAGAGVRFTVTASNGGTTLRSATSGSDGYARSTMKLGKGKTAIGRYDLRADAGNGNASATASTTFSVR
jgi:hypothetical protein